jgi:hypothetical protein
MMITETLQKETPFQPSDVTEISLPFPDVPEPHLKLAVGACRLRVHPGDGEAWVKGTYHDPGGTLPLQVEEDGGTARISQLPNWETFFGWVRGVPTLDLALGEMHPYRLTIETGASESILGLGSLPLTSVVVRHGAGTMEVDFSAPNPDSMSKLTLENGAGTIRLASLANANFAEVSVEGGAASYQLDFGGTLRQDAQVRVTTGVSSVEIAIPASTAAKVNVEAVLGGLAVSDGFMKKEGAFWTEAALAGQTPMLIMHVNVTLGALHLRVT